MTIGGGGGVMTEPKYVEDEITGKFRAYWEYWDSNILHLVQKFSQTEESEAGGFLLQCVPELNFSEG